MHGCMKQRSGDGGESRLKEDCLLLLLVVLLQLLVLQLLPLAPSSCCSWSWVFVIVLHTLLVALRLQWMLTYTRLTGAHRKEGAAAF